MIHLYQHISYADKPILERFIFDPPFKAREAMKDEACLVYAAQGSSTIHGEQVSASLQTGEAVLMKCGRFINTWHVVAEGEKVEAIAIHLYPAILKQIYDHEVPDFLKKSSSRQVACAQVIRQERALQNFFEGIMFYFENPDLADSTLVQLKLKELILILYHCENSAVRVLLESLFEEDKVAFKDVIHKHIMQPLTLEELAFLTNSSLSTFKRKFRTIFNESPARYIKMKRLEKAADLLKFTKLPVASVAYDCGFQDSKSFAKNFKLQFHQTPTGYRKQFLS